MIFTKRVQYTNHGLTVYYFRQHRWCSG